MNGLVPAGNRPGTLQRGHLYIKSLVLSDGFLVHWNILRENGILVQRPSCLQCLLMGVNGG